MIEIEHKFLLENDDWRALVESTSLYQQAYISTKTGTTVRVRMAGEVGYLTLKGMPEGDKGISRTEFEYQIPREEAETMIDKFTDSPVIKKYRHLVNYGGKTWEIDEFLGDNTGLVVAEVEMDSEDEEFELPHWAGACVSDDFKYSNVSLVENPYNTWKK